MRITVEIEHDDLELLNALALKEFRTPGKQLAYMVANLLHSQFPPQLLIPLPSQELLDGMQEQQERVSRQALFGAIPALVPDEHSETPIPTSMIDFNDDHDFDPRNEDTPSNNSYAEAQELDGFKVGEEVTVGKAGEAGVIQDIDHDDGTLQVRLEQGIGADSPWFEPKALTHIPEQTADKG